MQQLWKPEQIDPHFQEFENIPDEAYDDE